MCLSNKFYRTAESPKSTKNRQVNIKWNIQHLDIRGCKEWYLLILCNILFL